MEMSVFDPNGPIFCHFSNAGGRVWVLLEELSELLRLLARSGEVPITCLQTFDFQEHQLLPGAFAARSPFRRWVFRPGSLTVGAKSLRSVCVVDRGSAGVRSKTTWACLFALVAG